MSALSPDVSNVVRRLTDMLTLNFSTDELPVEIEVVNGNLIRFKLDDEYLPEDCLVISDSHPLGAAENFIRLTVNDIHQITIDRAWPSYILRIVSHLVWYLEALESYPWSEPDKEPPRYYYNPEANVYCVRFNGYQFIVKGYVDVCRDIPNNAIFNYIEFNLNFVIDESDIVNVDLKDNMVVIGLNGKNYFTNMTRPHFKEIFDWTL